MGSRGKKRVRANGQVASGKQVAQPRSIFVPPVGSEQVKAGLDALDAALSAAGRPEPDSEPWKAAYRSVQDRVQAEHGVEMGDAILWRTTFLDALLGWNEFAVMHAAAGDLPTAAMLEVAALIPTHGAETSFDLDLFEEMLAEQKGSAIPAVTPRPRPA